MAVRNGDRRVRRVLSPPCRGGPGRSVRSGAEAGEPPRRPGPEEVVAADGTERVEHLAREEEPGLAIALHRPRVYLPQADPAARDLGLLVALVAGPRQGVRGQGIQKATALVFAEVGAGAVGRYPGVGQEAVGETSGEGGAERRGDQPTAGLGQHGLPVGRRRVGPGDVDGRGVSARTSERGQVRHVEDGRAGVAAVREQEAAGSLEGPFRQRHAEVVLEEAALVGQRPRCQDATHQPPRRVGHEHPLVQHRRQHVAPAAAADHDLGPHPARLLEEHDARPGSARRQRGHQPGRAAAEDEHIGEKRGGREACHAARTPRPGRVSERRGEEEGSGPQAAAPWRRSGARSALRRGHPGVGGGRIARGARSSLDRHTGRAYVETVTGYIAVSGSDGSIGHFFSLDSVALPSWRSPCATLLGRRGSRSRPCRACSTRAARWGRARAAVS